MTQIRELMEHTLLAAGNYMRATCRIFEQAPTASLRMQLTAAAMLMGWLAEVDVRRQRRGWCWAFSADWPRGPRVFDAPDEAVWGLMPVIYAEHRVVFCTWAANLTGMRRLWRLKSVPQEDVWRALRERDTALPPRCHMPRPPWASLDLLYAAQEWEIGHNASDTAGLRTINFVLWALRQERGIPPVPEIYCDF